MTRPPKARIGGVCHLVKLLWLHPYDRLQVSVVWIGAGVGVTLGPDSESLDWAGVGVTLGPDSEVSVWALVSQCWG